ncbi:GvpT/GvpP family gas vesicle accessory protein [Alkalihalobacillus deserti]|uniref:GvpT/GvpP family gas vesicle accessory protein n=1 Tax=Alkalihalobacillus deserti TaxID=2879466 RepID=UPI001D14DA99|nr:GvpT/GvpP family gas vesicle accessory protein [Alkalihalobacillus deserti]
MNMTVKEKTEKPEEEVKAENNQKEENSNESSNSMNLAIIGGIVGAGIGLLSSPGTSQRVMKSLSESEVMRVASKELKRTAQEILTEQAVNSIRQTASGYMNKSGGSLLPNLKKNDDKEEKSDSDKDEQSSQYDEIKEDNKNLNERLDKIEDVLNQLVDSKK